MITRERAETAVVVLAFILDAGSAGILLVAEEVVREVTGWPERTRLDMVREWLE